MGEIFFHRSKCVTKEIYSCQLPRITFWTKFLGSNKRGIKKFKVLIKELKELKFLFYIKFIILNIKIDTINYRLFIFFLVKISSY